MEAGASFWYYIPVCQYKNRNNLTNFTYLRSSTTLLECCMPFKMGPADTGMFSRAITQPFIVLELLDFHTMCSLIDSIKMLNNSIFAQGEGYRSVA